MGGGGSKQNRPIGVQQMQDYYSNLSKSWQQAMAQFDLGTVGTEVLTRLASMETETPTRNISRLQEMLTNGLLASSKITETSEAEFLAAKMIHEADPRIKEVRLENKPGRPTRIIVIPA